jgi:putative FmdB family regulatory protein
MPIYAYRCATCGHARDVLQKISDPVLTACPECGAATFEKQVTAAGFQLKGSGWYVTDFRGGNSAGAKKDDKTEGGDKPAEKAADKPATDAPAAAAPSPAPASTPAPAPAPSPASE